jgi:amphi-Trp domain-containing protein
MSRESGEFRHESLQDCQSIVKYLKAITQGFESGHLALANGGEPIVLEPKGLLRLDLKARRKEDRIKLSIKVTWKEDEASEEVDTKPLVIDSQKD